MMDLTKIKELCAKAKPGSFEWWSYDPDGDGFEQHKTAEEAEKSAVKAFARDESACSDGWSENTESICWGRICGGVVELERRPVKPTDACSNCDEFVLYKLRDYASRHTEELAAAVPGLLAEVERIADEKLMRELEIAEGRTANDRLKREAEKLRAENERLSASIESARAIVFKYADDVLIPIEKSIRAAENEALERAAKLVASRCRCKPFWADYQRRDPDCHAHDLAEEIRALKMEQP
jgi:hypothetical protein